MQRLRCIGRKTTKQAAGDAMSWCSPVLELRQLAARDQQGMASLASPPARRHSLRKHLRQLAMHLPRRLLTLRACSSTWITAAA